MPKQNCSFSAIHNYNSYTCFEKINLDNRRVFRMVNEGFYRAVLMITKTGFSEQ